MGVAAPEVEAPLAATLARCAGLGIAGFPTRLGVGAPTGRRWLSRDEALEPATTAALMERIGRTAGTRKAAVQGTWLLEAWVGALAGAAAAAALTEGRVPDVSADNVLLRVRKDGRPAGVAFRRPDMAVLPGDPARGAPGVAVVPDREALWAWFRRRLVEHAAPLVEALRPLTGRGRGALWRSVGDACAGHLAWLGGELGLAERARADAALLLGRERPLHHAPTVQEVPCGGGVELVRVRAGCCLSYRCEDGPGVPCLACPRLTPAERAERL